MPGTTVHSVALNSCSKMDAWRVHEFGSPEVMVLESIPRPSPGPGEVLVKVGAAGVGPWDAWIRSGKSALPQPLPLTLGSDLAGEIDLLGPGVSNFSRGTQVFGVTNTQFLGAYAQYAVASASMLASKPKTLGFVEAASVPVVAVTAWRALFDHARLEPGQTVVIHGAAGNVGGYALQLAHRSGIRCIVTAGAEDTDYVHGLGADRVIDYRTQRFEEEIKDVDAVLDLLGGDTQARSYQILRAGGRLISTVSQPDQQLAKQHGVEAAFFLVEVTTERLNRIGGLIDHGELKTHVGAVLPLSEARKAHLMLDGRLPPAKGKIVLRVR
jgi:NADPH:quinone reductase-like Zn-dependent oxidoreductase